MKKNILFCGTPKFAVTSLHALFKYQFSLGYNLLGVITIRDKIANRGKKLHESAIKKEAKNLKLKVYEPDDLSGVDFINEIKKLNLDLIVVVAFKKLPKVLFEIPKIGTINIHGSLLPKYRGASPINHALLNDEKETGLTTFFINENIDTGDIIKQSKIEIDEEWHVDDLHDHLMNMSKDILKDTIKTVFSKSYATSKQTEIIDQKTKYAPKIKKINYIINPLFWKKELREIYNFIRGMSPPGIKTQLFIKIDNNEAIKKNIIITRISTYTKLHQPQLTHADIHKTGNQIIVRNNVGFFIIEKIKIENKKEFRSHEFINGFLKKKNKKTTISFYN